MKNLSFINPFRASGNWWKGNLHTHTTVSDGGLCPDETAQGYRNLGYDFLAITDHRTLVEGVNAPPGLLMVPGAEYDTLDVDPGKKWHLVSIGQTSEITTSGGPVNELHDEVRDKSAFYFMAHPYWSDLGDSDLLSISDFPAVEIYNTLAERLNNRGESGEVIDQLLHSGKRLNCLAVDDSHNVADFGRGWIMLRSDNLDVESVCDALARGMFYASTGPEIHDISVEEDTVSVECSPCASITFFADSQMGGNFVADPGEQLTSAQYKMQGREKYVRVSCATASGRKAWANPMYPEWPVEE